MEYEQIAERVRYALDRLYEADHFLIDMDLCEPSVNHRFAMYLQEAFPGYFVDCEYNRSHVGQDSGLKQVTSRRGNYIDVVVGMRNGNPDDDLICFETKRWNNRSRFGDRDRAKLRTLTAGERFSYDYGLYLVFGRTRQEVEFELYQGGTITLQGIL